MLPHDLQIDSFIEVVQSSTECDPVPFVYFAQIYIGEIASGHLRSILCSSCSVFSCAGATVGLALASVLHYFYVSIFCIAIVSTNFVLTYFFCPGTRIFRPITAPFFSIFLVKKHGGYYTPEVQNNVNKLKS
jgi:hypothetical protein